MLSKLLDIPNNLSVGVEKAECGKKRTTKKTAAGVRRRHKAIYRFMTFICFIGHIRS